MPSRKIQAALRSWRPSSISPLILLQKASRSSGLRDVINAWSVTTAASCQRPPAFFTSVAIEG